MKGKSVVHASGGSNSHETPPFLFNYFNEIYEFNLDPAASHENHLCDRYFTEEDNALKQDWGPSFSAFENPPYSGGGIQRKFIEKTLAELEKYEFDAKAMLLIPSRPDTKIWQRLIFPNAKFIYYPDERLHFSYAAHGAGFPSAFIFLDGATIYFEKMRSYQEAGPVRHIKAVQMRLVLKEIPGYKEYKERVAENKRIYDEAQELLKLDADGKTGGTGVLSSVSRMDDTEDRGRRGPETAD